jgi:hypothetical protein
MGNSQINSPMLPRAGPVPRRKLKRRRPTNSGRRRQISAGSKKTHPKKTPLSDRLIYRTFRTPVTTPSCDWARRYEELRKEVVDGSAGKGWGLVLLLRQGLKAWMRAWPPCVSPPVRQDRLPLPEAALVPLLRQQIVLVLAGMILHRRREVMP